MADILIVDDDEETRVTLGIALRGRGHIVREAADGIAALQMYDERPTELVIMDLIMPGKEGIECIIEIRRRNRPVKIIAISGAAYNLNVAKKLGAGYTLEKPFTHETIMALLGVALDSE